MSKLHVLTLVSLLLLMVVVGCSSSDQDAIDKAVSATLAAAQPPTAVVASTSTREPVATDTPAPEPTATLAPTATPEPTKTPQPTVAPTATEVPPSLSITSFRCYTNADLHFAVSGEVRNAGSNPWDDLVVVALWYDSSGGLITTSTAIINDLPFQTAAILSFAVESSGRAAVQLDRCDVEFRSGGLLIAKTTESLPELAMRVEPSPTAIPRPTPATGDWVTGFYTDPLTRVTAYNASLTAEVGSNFVDTPYSMSILGCGDDLKDAIIAIEWGEYIASGESVTVTYRIDERDLEEDSGWFTSSAGDSTYKFRNTRQMIESLSSGAQFIARVTPYNDASVTGVWDLEGIEEVANTITDTCNW